MHGFLALLAILGFSPAPAHAAEGLKTLEIMVEDAAEPWSNPDGTGLANDIVVAAFKEMGVDVKLKVVPYARCKAAVLDGFAAACFSMTWLPEFEGKIRLAKDPLITLNADIFENAEAPVPKASGGKCMLPTGTVVGTVHGYEYPDEVMALQKQGVVFEPSRSDSQSIQKLARKRIGAAVILTNDFEPRNIKVKSEQLDSSVRFAFRCGTETGTIGFSLKHRNGPKAYEIYEKGYRKVKSRGVIKTIVEKWFGKH